MHKTYGRKVNRQGKYRHFNVRVSEKNGTEVTFEKKMA